MDEINERKEFETFMRDLGVRLFCPVCGEADYYNDLAEFPSKLQAPNRRQILAIICHQCGYVRLFSRDTLDRENIFPDNP